MALNVASLLDGASLGQGTLDKALSGMNKVLTIKNVSLDAKEKCSVIVTIGLRSYVFSTQSNGVLQVSAAGGTELVKALAKCDARLVLDPVAFNNEVGNLGEAWEEALRERRKLYIEGDETMYVSLHNALVPHVSSLQAATPTVIGVTQDPNLSMDIWKGLEPPSLQVASLSPDSWQPPLGDQMKGWLMFSAVSTMFGNLGQSNYVVSNQVMDALTFHSRQIGGYLEATTMMWGTVGHMGMRWKAFGSADMIYQTDGAEDIVMMPFEAAIVLQTIFQGVCPEWFVANKFDTQTQMLYKAGGFPQRSSWTKESGFPEPPNPWGHGKGGGNVVSGDELPHHLPSQSAAADPKPAASSTSGSSAYVGRRVRLQRLQKMPEMNGKKGALVEELQDGNWVVRLDSGLGDRILKVSNLMTLSGLQLGTGARCSDAVVLPPADVYVKAC